ncbi:arf-GAP with Rho-GAP domain, ANK repeat and PH domain-containing protein 3-like isoform X2 [Xyrauchen texanus]|uniref:arf-GAP with Rho-GAP domain, ANK repeat and PH domain-containing protein 3-like isoform X2 n=1 Tax=Xyrauchen texanus TaxID=154827 RepID=UPI002241ECC2|nr:arf-GAP with Rho-GAP domain, ANK repeat and PH domain-containing protein 3-like isoform X2 [Xyrauchen texanus]
MQTMATIGPCSDAEDLLASIHLERYLDQFRQAGFLLTRDFCHVDNAALNRVGVTATGHRKRILKLVEHIQSICQYQWKESLLDRCNSESAIHEVTPVNTEPLSPSGHAGTSFESLRNSSAPNLCAQVKHSYSEHSATVIKPVPKPRTVFHKLRSERRSLITQHETQPCRKSSQEPLSLKVAEDSSSSASSIDTVETSTEPKQGLCEPSLSNTSSAPETGGPLPPVPPRLNRGNTPSTFMRMSDLDQLSTQPLPSPPDSSSSCQCSPFTNTFTGSPPSPPCSGLEMVSNEIYCGTLPGTPCMLWSRSVPVPPPRQEDSPSTENHSTLDKNNTFESPQTMSASAEDDDEIINPYCETVFQSKRQYQHSKVERTKIEGKSGTTNNEGKLKDQRQQNHSWLKRLDSPGYCTVGEPSPASHSFSLPHNFYSSEADEDHVISPYASFTSLSERVAPILSGCLDKLSPQGYAPSGLLLASSRLCISCTPLNACFYLLSVLSSRNYVFQKRYVKFDGKNLMYYGSEKDAYPKGVIPLAAIQMARLAKDNKFEVVTSHRTFVFRADNDVQRSTWCSTLQERVKEQLVFGYPRFGPGSHCQKRGFLELKGTKSKIYTAIIMEQIWLYKSEQCFKNGIGITVIEARGATVRDGKGRSFDLITPYKSFSFTAESEREKRDWMEALQESIAETLSDYEVAEKIWSNRSNKICADCKAINPDWASINLCVVICKNCAGQHRGLGTMVSKVQSLKLDTSVWSNEIVQLFIMLGNDRANEFWAARLPVTEELDRDASPEQRKEFIIHKYREGRYRYSHPSFSSQEELLKVLCTAMSEQNLLKTVTQIFAEADAARLSDANGNNKRRSPHYSYTQSADSCVYDEIMQPILYSGYLYKSGSLNKGTLSRRTRDDFQKYWCSVEKSILFYESDRCHEPSTKIDIKDIICLGVSRPDSCNNSGLTDKFRFTFELYLTSDKLVQFGLETPEALHSWARAIGKAITPLSCHCLLTREFERVGVLRYKAMLDPQQWKEGFFVLQKSNLFICPGNDGAAEDIINLKRLQELKTENHEKKDILVLVEKGRTLHLQGMGRTDLSLWYTDIQKSAGGKGNTLKDQQLSRNDIPIIVDSCIAFITQYGLGHEGIYRKNGAKSRINLLMEEFRKDARNVKLRIGDNFIEDVTDVLKRFFREIDDPIFMADLHPFWREAAKIPQKTQRLDRYKELIRGLPLVNRTTLSALISHLYRVQKCADLNQMCTKNLSLLFAPSLFQTDGKGEHEVKIIQDLIDNYLYIFDIDEEHQTQIELEISLITTWRDTQLSQAGDLIIEVYLEEKVPDCCITLKVSPTMCAEELTNQVLYMRNIPAGERDVWMAFEAIEEGELERPLHPKEKVLEQALQWCKMADPSSAYLVVKKVSRGEAIDIFTAYKSEIVKSGVLKCREEPPKLLQGNKFQERSFQIKDHKLLLLKDKKTNKPEKEWQLKTLKVYMGIRKKLKPPTKWGFTVMLDKHQMYLSCSCETELWDWMTNLLKSQNDDLHPPVMRRHSSSDISKQRFGTMPLVPIRGEKSNTNSTMLSANQTLRKLHTRRALSMFFPMKMQQDSFEESIESPEPLYEEVGDFGLQVLKSLETSFLSSARAETQEVPARPVSLGQRRAAFLDRLVGPNPMHRMRGEGTLSFGESLDILGQDDPSNSVHVQDRHRSHRSCSPQQELLLQELSTMFGNKPESEE